tara:strand:+ start:452 stop:1036 length:585 start_codon:yes stop_codon:yes gene_type:complete
MSKNSKPSVSKAERLLFEKVLSDVKPIENDGPLSNSGQEAVKIPRRTKNTTRKDLSTQTKSKPSQKPLFLNNFLPGKAPGLDRSSAIKLAKGKFTIQGRLDLHGMTQRQAHAALIDFIQTSFNDRKRNLLVITGKGRPRGRDEVGVYGEGKGILKSIVPKWLDESPLQSLVLAVTTSQREHGGAGALYVLLRKN